MRDTRVLQVGLQIALLLAVGLTIAFVVNNVRSNLQASNIPMGWSFLQQTAGFEISEGVGYDPTETYWQAYLVGVRNTLRVVAYGIVLATIVGVFAGIARLSSNWLVRSIATVYVETIRNTPLLLQLFFWYFGVMMLLPDIKDAANVGDYAVISIRGVAVGWFYLSETGRAWFWWLLAAAVVAAVTWYIQRRRLNAMGRLNSALPMALLAFLVTAAIGYFVTWRTAELPPTVTYELRRGDRGNLFVDGNANGEYDRETDQPMRRVSVGLLSSSGAVVGEALTDEEGAFRIEEPAEEGTSLTWTTPPPVVYSAPALQGFNVRGGRTFSPEFTALLLGLVLYTGAFIAEIVRAGVNSVPKGQWEASRAVGLSASDTLRLVVLPQALRVIIPPLTSQYLNLTKNSSLAIAVGYPDLFNVSMTIMNQSGATVQMFIILMSTYLIFSLITSLFMNWYNKRIALVER
jgi:general L-amino acid transport system permease protein